MNAHPYREELLLTDVSVEEDGLPTGVEVDEFGEVINFGVNYDPKIPIFVVLRAWKIT